MASKENAARKRTEYSTSGIEPEHILLVLEVHIIADDDELTAF